MNKCLTVFLLLALNLLRAAHANTMYVSLSGSDNASGTFAAPVAHDPAWCGRAQTW